MLDQHALRSGSAAEGSDGVSWESLQNQKIILLRRKHNGGSDLVNVQVSNTTYVLKRLQNENHKNTTYIQHREWLWISDYESWLQSGCTSQPHCCKNTVISVHYTHVNEWPLSIAVPIKIVFSFPRQLCSRFKAKWQQWTRPKLFQLYSWGSLGLLSTQEANVEENRPADWFYEMAERRNRHSGNSLKIQDNRTLIQFYAVLWLLVCAHPETKVSGSPHLKWALG